MKPLFYKNTFYISVCIAVLIQVILAFQGFDICDDGFVLTFYQQFFNNPESVEYNFLYWTCGLIGGLWYQLFEDGGILWFRFFGVLVNTITFVLAYNVLKKHIDKSFLLFALLMVLFVNNYGFLTFYHNHLTALFSVLIIYVLDKALHSKNNFGFFLAGVILAFNTLVRIPNVLFFIVLLGIPYFYFMRKISLSKALKKILITIAGILLGFGAIVLLLLSFNQFEVMKNALLVLIDLGQTDDSAHNFSDLIMAQFYNYFSVCKAAIKLVVIALIYSLLKYSIGKKAVISYVINGLLIVALIFWFNNTGIFAVYALALFGCFAILWLKLFKPEIKVIAFMALITLVILPVGTGGGIFNSGYMAIWLSLPLFFKAVKPSFKYFEDKFKIHNFKISSLINNTTLWCFVIAFLGLKAYRISNEAYFDKGNRFKKTATINNPLTQHIYTTPKRAKIINDILEELKNHVKPNDFLFTYNHIPMLNYLTETQPYAYNPWVGIYDSNSFEKKIKRAEKDIKKMPIIVQQKFETIMEFSQPIEDYMSVKKENTMHHNNNNNAVMNAFLKRNQYQIIWQNSYFNIYKSSKTDTQNN